MINYNLRLINKIYTTKRSILSDISKIFDLLGLVGPVIVKAKIILQKLWLLKLDWDESIPLNLKTEWLNVVEQLMELHKICVPRQFILKNPIEIFIHGFSDASLLAYGACVYLYAKDRFGNISSHLIAAKSRIAPVKVISLPRLELCGALISSQLINKIVCAMNINLNGIFYWTDSEIVLAWLAKEPANWTMFVRNRVSQIQEFTKNGIWKHINSNDNPADIISRGAYPQQLHDSYLWFEGPKFLKSPQEQWPSFTLNEIDVPEQCTKYSSFIVSENINKIYSVYYTKFSSYTRLIRTTAYIYRFYNNIRARLYKKQTIQDLNLSPIEITRSEISLVKLVQQLRFSQEINDLRTKNRVNNNSKLVNLNPFLDEFGIIRVGGRLKNSDFDYAKKHPMVLPPNDHFTKILITYEHCRTLHGGCQLVLSTLRNRFWPLNGKSVVRQQIRKCIICFKAKPRFMNVMMGDLPA